MRLSKYFNIKSIIQYLLVLGILTVTVFYVIVAFKNFIGADASYYLGATEFIYNGKIPNKDFLLSYTPLSFYIMLIPRAFMGSMPSYTVFLLVLYIFLYASAFLTSAIVYKFTKSKILFLFSFFLYILYAYLLEGIYYGLESFSTFFGMLSLYILFKDEVKNNCNLILIGVFSAMAFASKQYGLGFIGLVGLYTLFYSKSKIKDLLFIGIGFVSILFMILLFFILEGVDIHNLIVYISGGSYGERTANYYLKGLQLMFSPKNGIALIWLVPILTVFLVKNKNFKIIFISLIAIVAFSLQFYFQVFPHYLLFIIPFVVIILFISLNELNDKIPTAFWALFILITLQSAYLFKIEYRRTNSINKIDFRSEQIANSEGIKKQILNKNIKSIYCIGSPVLPYYFLLNIPPSKFKEYGYSFGFESEIQMLDRIENADMIILYYKNYENMCSNKSHLFLDSLENNHSLVIVNDSIVLFIKQDI